MYREAELIDTKQFADWYELFTDDALYWMPLAIGQTESDLYNALFFEDKLMLQVRIERLAHPRAFSQTPPSYCQHILQAPALVEQDPAGSSVDRVKVRTPFMYVESQGDAQFFLAGVVWHDLVLIDDALRIYRKRIDLLNPEAALPSIQLFP